MITPAFRNIIASCKHNAQLQQPKQQSHERKSMGGLSSSLSRRGMFKFRKASSDSKLGIDTATNSISSANNATTTRPRRRWSIESFDTDPTLDNSDSSLTIDASDTTATTTRSRRRRGSDSSVFTCVPSSRISSSNSDRPIQRQLHAIEQYTISTPAVPTTVQTTQEHFNEIPYSYIHDGTHYQGLYIGELKHGMPHGIGTWLTVNNTSSIRIEGEWFCGFNISGDKQYVNMVRERSRSLKEKEEQHVVLSRRLPSVLEDSLYEDDFSNK